MNWPVERDLPEGRHQLLKEFVMTEIEKQKKPKRGLLRPLVLAPVLAGAAALAIAVPTLLGGGEPAYAVTDNPDGTVLIEINELRDPDGLQAALRRRGYNVVVNYIPDGKKCSPQPRSTNWVPDSKTIRMPTGDFSTPTFLFDPSVIKAGQTAVLEFSISEPLPPEVSIKPGQENVVDLESQAGGMLIGVWDRVSKGPVADCKLVDTTEAPLSH
ncbi:hypothetical protein ABT294_21735 [Nonomuraea sp. NPDC000554]|uniref:hypothetical protein n=1 Tax=Nonomuraea sp. NPDC000554 TaxID=3154259 RepID=UPI0033171B61